MKLTVNYARVVTMTATIEHDDPDDVQGIEAKLPGVYDGIPADLVPDAVEDVSDYDAIWDVDEADADAEVCVKRG